MMSPRDRSFGAFWASVIVLFLAFSVDAQVPPVVTGFSPAAAAQGQAVIVTGTSFTGATAVTIAGANASFTVNSATQITATVPPSAGGSGPICVMTPAGTGCSASNLIVCSQPGINSSNNTCSNSTGNTASLPTGGTGYSWTVTNGTITAGATTNQVTFTADASGTVNLAAAFTDACSIGRTASRDITIGAQTPGIFATDTVCANSTGNNAGTQLQTGATYLWSITGGTITSANNLTNITYTAGASGNVTLTVSVTSCGSTLSQSSSIPIDAVPAPVINASDSACANQPLTAFATSYPGATYNWTITNGTLTSATTGSSINFTTGASGTTTTLNVSVTLCGRSAGTQKNVVVDPPTAPFISAPATVCPNSTGNSASPVFFNTAAAVTYAWTISGGTITSATNTPTITYTAGASGTVTLGLTATRCGTARSASQNVTIANPPPPINGPSSVCGNSTGNTVSTNAVTGGTYNWTVTNGTLTSGQGTTSAQFTAGATGSVTIGLTVTSPSCGTTTNARTLPISPLPAATISASSTLCASSTGNSASVPSGAGNAYAWTISNGTITAGQGTNVITYTAGTSGDIALSVVVISSCGVLNSGSTTLPVGGVPVVSIGTPSGICANSTGNSTSAFGSPSSPPPGSTYVWTIGNGTITAGQGTSNITYSAGASGEITFGVTVTSCGVSFSTTRVILIDPPVGANINASSTVCANSTGNSASTSAPPGATFAWSITNGTITSATNTPSINYTAGASGSVVLSVTVAACGRSGSSSFNVPINGTPNLSIGLTSGSPVVCPSSTGNGANVFGAIPGSTFNWTITNGTITSPATGSTITFTSGASGVVGLTASVTSCGITTTTSSNIDIGTLITTPIQTSPMVCAGSTNNVAETFAWPPGATFNWTITNGTLTSSPTASLVTYTAGASGSVTLGLSVNSCGQTRTGSFPVALDTFPAGLSIFSSAGVCPNSPSSANAPFISGATYAWTITNGTLTSPTTGTNISFTAGTAGTLTLGVTITACGRSIALTRNLQVGGVPNATITTSTPGFSSDPSVVGACPNTLYQAGVAGYTGATYNWIVTNATITGSNTNSAVNFKPTGAGDAVAAVSITFCGATASSSKTIPVNIPPNVALSVPTGVCANSSNTASTPSIPNATYAWTISGGTITAGQGTSSITYAAAASGTIILGLTVTTCGGSTSTSRPIIINPAPDAGFDTTAAVCANSTGNIATVFDGVAFTWSISNGTITAGQGTSQITYTAGASGDVTLGVTVQSSCAVTTSTTQLIPINGTPNITISSPPSVCANATSTATANGAPAGSTLIWTVTNGTITAGQGTSQITYTAGASGDVTFRLSVNACGVSPAAIIRAIPINTVAAPVIRSATTVCPNSVGRASVPNNLIAPGSTIVWSITNGTITSGQGTRNINFTSGPSGNVALSVSVTGCGVTSSATATIPIGAPPNLFLNARSFTLCPATTGNSMGVSGEPGGSSYAWTITNGTITAGASSPFIFFTPGPSGIVTGTVTVTTCGTSYTRSLSLPIAGTTTPGMSVTRTCPNSTGNVAAVAGGLFPPEATYSWSIVNGTINSSAAAPRITYTAGSSGTVDLTAVVSYCGSSTTIKRSVPIDLLPTDFSTPAGVCPNKTGYAATATGPPDASFQWTITNGTITSATTARSINFTSGASGNVGLIVNITGACGRSTTVTKSIPIGSPPSATFEVRRTLHADDPLITNLCANGRFTVFAPFYPDATYSWSATNATILDNTTDSGVIFQAGSSGSVTLSVTITSCGGTTTNSVTLPIGVVPNSTITAPASACPNSTTNNASVAAVVDGTYAWTITNGTITSPANTPNITFTAGSSGSVTLNATVTSFCGITSTSSRVVPVDAVTITAPAAMCQGVSSNATATTSLTGATFNWTITGGTMTGGQGTAAITFSATGGASVLLGVTASTATCTTTNTASVTVNAVPPATITAPASVCGNSTGNTASVPATAGTTYSWTITGGTITTGAGTNMITFTADASGNVALSVTATAGSCAASGSATVSITPTPVSTITAPANVLAASTGNTASVANAGAGASYVWSLSSGSITAGAGTPSITWTASTTTSVTIIVTVTAGSGCTSSGSRTIQISAQPGDVNGDGNVTGGDVFYLINNLFASGPPPIGPGDANGDGQVTVGDIFYLINFLFAGGPAPR